MQEQWNIRDEICKKGLIKDYVLKISEKKRMVSRVKFIIQVRNIYI